QRLVDVAVYALIYEVDGNRPRRVLLPCRDDWDRGCACPLHPEDLDVEQFFSDCPRVSSVDCLPGTLCSLANGYTIISVSQTDHYSGATPRNQAIQRQFSIQWLGSLVIIKRGRRHRARAVHITPPEVSLINSVVQR
ncbi:hypothetical protein FKP32DRAFT_1567365, partial [Trametes sanguinea]